MVPRPERFLLAFEQGNTPKTIKMDGGVMAKSRISAWSRIPPQVQETPEKRPSRDGQMPCHAGWVALLLLVGLAACGPVERQTGGQEALMTIELTSPVFEQGGEIPTKYTCDGQDISPPLNWEGVPEGTESLVLIVDDPDAPSQTWVHWVLYDMDPDRTMLAEGLKPSPVLEGVGIQGVTSFRDTGYGGPCPPSGSSHRYLFKLYALDRKLNLGEEATKAEVVEAMESSILAQGELMGRYQR
jgi:Raf kinase inhibitor-like YbhB/YbcL family protein